LVTECLRYSLRPETKNTGSGEEVKALPDTIKMLKTRVEELEKSEGALKERVCAAETLLGEMKSKLEERFGGEW
jgi:predicted  nucleic acid-binding Zn-ribbon protein